MSADAATDQTTLEEVYAYVKKTRELCLEMVDRMLWLEESALVQNAIYLLDQVTAMERAMVEEQKAALDAWLANQDGVTS